MLSYFWNGKMGSSCLGSPLELKNFSGTKCFCDDFIEPFQKHWKIESQEGKWLAQTHTAIVTDKSLLKPRLQPPKAKIFLSSKQCAKKMDFWGTEKGPEGHPFQLEMMPKHLRICMPHFNKVQTVIRNFKHSDHWPGSWHVALTWRQAVWPWLTSERHFERPCH